MIEMEEMILEMIKKSYN